MSNETALGVCARELRHARRILCLAYQRSDGLWEVEAEVSDQKQEMVTFRSREPVKPGEFIHRMTISFLIDGNDLVKDVRAKLLTGPWRECVDAENAYSRLIGIRVVPGFQRVVRERIGRGQGCSHISDVILQVGNTYLQATWPSRVARQRAIDSDARNWSDPLATNFVGECHAWRRGGDALHAEFPEFENRTEDK